MKRQVRFSWRIQEDAPTTEAAALVEGLRADPDASVSLLTGEAFVGTAILIIAGVAGASYLAAQIQNLVCKSRKAGVVIDARQDPLLIKEVGELPGGTVITINAEGRQETHDACATGFDLAEVISALGSAG